MILGVISDTHGHQQAVSAALRLLQARGANCIVHCGDVDDASTLYLFAGTTLHLVLGNCDPPAQRLQEVIDQIGARLHGRFGTLQLAERRFAFLHGDDRQRLDYTIRSGSFDVVFHGHTHQRRCIRLGRTLVVNPGALIRVATPTVALVHLPKVEVEFLDVSVT